MTPQKQNQPALLPFLFLTEMWERFGFYIVQGLLILYMTKFYGLSDDESYTISGIFGGLIYISPFLGGYLADKLLGFKTAVIWGGFFLIAGYLLLSFSYFHFLFYPALSTIIVGNGLLKPNISSLLGTQYEAHDTRRDSGFTLFYIGINLGVFFSGFSGYIRDAFGWQVVFALASLGMLIGLASFFYGIKYIKPKQAINPLKLKTKLQLFIYCLLAIAGLSFLLNVTALTNLLLPAAGILLFVFLIVLTLQQPPEYRKNMIVLTILILASIVFWMLFYQLFNSANLYIDRLVNKNVFGLHLNTTIFYASESIFIILLGPLFAWSWQTLGRNKKNPSPVNKFILSIFITGLGFLSMSVSALFPDKAGLVSPFWIFFSYLLLTIGELLLSPIGLSAMTQLSPPHLSGMMMGVWFVSLGFGGIFAGWIAKLSSVPNANASMTDKLAIYHHAFLDYAYLAFFITIVLVFVQFAMKKFMRK